MNRFCSHCQAEVEDVGGFCLLGHPLAKAAPDIGSLTALRAEVDRAFEDARVQVATVVGGVSSSAPPPPPPADATAPSRTTYPVIEQTVTGPDPIADFAPAPRMDWGPEKKSLLKRRG